MEIAEKTPAVHISHSEMIAKARSASGFLKALSNETRLIILCQLLPGGRTVSELEQLIGVRQANVSQHLARLKEDGLVFAERNGKTVTYQIDDPDALEILLILYQRYCAGPAEGTV